ncbi:tRNA (5-methylaminomethyl-2-thiouridine)(34)-methyltransferase MnmD [Sphingobacterium sp. CZ-2]|uniref:tRNA (5-methylaminomethyl-2-thiouridine)(34)-methyltransferase MnmD n=1 Tax=Sphingobacterium sp. CZ-2 TaxID=2557994 RepID=UPI00106FC41A|nr:tRNA (5-methylaminomethyl-2-thiouridine)(34)-methyltransferase MnmD [Sphingobacterium sp. CZ-2]QBR12385.1 methyltransferase domain-containing protein [Sphingobacterium sp. CZ-2]
MEFVNTGDGSKTLYHEEVGEHYHSKHGAYQESIHVFLKTGLQYWLEKENKQAAAILEIGFGTGLNFLLSADWAMKNKVGLDYVGIEAYPLEKDLLVQSGYDSYIANELWTSFIKEYETAQQGKTQIIEHILLKIAVQKVMDFQTDQMFDVIYFDAFAEIHQPEMWTAETLSHVVQFLNPGGVFVTYAITGNLKRAMKALGFSIEKAAGAPGKREMLRATKL